MLILKEDASKHSVMAAGMIGAMVQAVRYQQTEFGGLAAAPSGAAHEVDLDVFMDLSTGLVEWTWERDDLVEGLAVNPAQEGPPQEGVVTIPAGDSDPWRAVVGGQITSLHAGWQVSESGCPESLWAMRLTIGHSANVVIALGELDAQGRPTYHPDSILVLFDEQMARSYKPSGAITSAWGDMGTFGNQ